MLLIITLSPKCRLEMGGFGQLADMMCDYDCTEKQLYGRVRAKFHIILRTFCAASLLVAFSLYKIYHYN